MARNGEGRQRPRQLVASVDLFEEAGLQDHLRQLFDKQRHAIRLGDHLFDDFGGEHLAVCHPSTHLRRLVWR